MKVLSVDVGVKHLGLILVEVNDDYTLQRIVAFDCVDITRFHSSSAEERACSLHHEKTYGDYMMHVFKQYGSYFDASVILIERQPLTGYVVIEQLIFYTFRNKSVLVSPNSMHAFMGWNKRCLDYEGRKDESIRELTMCLSSDQQERLNRLVRKHDVSDAFCMFKLWSSREIRAYEKTKKKELYERGVKTARENGLYHFDIFLDQFKFVQ